MCRQGRELVLSEIHVLYQLPMGPFANGPHPIGKLAVPLTNEKYLLHGRGKYEVYILVIYLLTGQTSIGQPKVK
jgi:hypothetical protein